MGGGTERGEENGREEKEKVRRKGKRNRGKEIGIVKG